MPVLRRRVQRIRVLHAEFLRPRCAARASASRSDADSRAPPHLNADYATNNLGLTAADGATSVALISALSALGRVVRPLPPFPLPLTHTLYAYYYYCAQLLGLLGDKCGHVNALAVCQGMGAVAQMAVWPFARGRAGLMGFCALYGFFSGGFVSLVRAFRDTILYMVDSYLTTTTAQYPVGKRLSWHFHARREFDSVGCVQLRRICTARNTSRMLRGGYFLGISYVASVFTAGDRRSPPLPSFLVGVCSQVP